MIERIVCLDAINVMTIEPEMFVKYFKYYYDDFYNPKKYPIFNEITPPPTYTYEQVLYCASFRNKMNCNNLFYN